jgi:hypothetical protein
VAELKEICAHFETSHELWDGIHLASSIRVGSDRKT